MARTETDREDLLREATAYGRRAECRVPGRDDVVFAGIKTTGEVSVYFGADPVLHLDAEARLRRAFVDGDPYRTQGSTLARLRRQRSDKETVLLRHDLDSVALDEFLADVRTRLRQLADAIDAGSITTLAAIPEGDDPWSDIAAAVRRHLALADPLAPAVPGKR